MLVLLKALIYNMYPVTSVEVTVTWLVPVADVPPVVGVIGIFTLPFVAIDSSV